MAALLALPGGAAAATYSATPSNYRSLLTTLKPGDVLTLTAGDYTLLPVSNLRGSPSAWITITGPASGSPARIIGSSCCNTVELFNVSYVAIKNLTIDSLGIEGLFGLSAKGGTTNLTHDILIENNSFVGQNGGQQTAGISTKTPTWGWTIRRNTIIGAGTGLYLGNSDGTQPFIAGIIENNLVQDTIGYNMQIKWQLPRPTVAGMPTGPSKTIIRNNVFIKNDQPSPDGDRPNVLVGGFPDSGPGSSDMYEVYGNFFYHNPREALFQGSGRVSVHDNVFVDSYYPSISLKAQDLPLKVAYVYNNTIYTKNGGMAIYSATLDDNVSGNLVFGATPISGVIAHQFNNTVDSFANAAKYVNAPAFTLGAMDFYPRVGMAQGAAIDLSAFGGETDWGIDFNGTPKSAAKQSIVFRGAYAGEGTNPGWTLQAGIKPSGAVSVPTPSGTTPVIHVKGEPAELSGTANGAAVTPAIAPANLSGRLVVTAGGSVNFAPGYSGSGVYFQKCCLNTANAYYRFTGQGVGTAFGTSQGQVTFYLTSRSSLAQRALASSYRMVFDVRDDNPANHLFTFLTQVVSGRLLFRYFAGGVTRFYYVPQGTEDAVFGLGKTLKVSIVWQANAIKLYLNDVLAQASPYTPSAANWTARSLLNLGAYEYATYGGYDSCDDVIDEFTVGPPQ
jgi:hypothetical protein